MLESVWLTAVSSALPQLGDLWLISWDSRALALGVVTRVTPNFVTCWPVTLVDNQVFARALLVEASPLGVPLLVWPTRETGLGLHMLHRRFGQLLSRATIVLVDAALEDGDELPLPLAPRTIDGDEAEQASDRMVELWQDICLNIWPTAVPGQTALNAAAIRRAGMQASDLAEALAVPLPTAVSLLRGEHFPTAEELAQLADLLETDVQGLLETGEGTQDETLLLPELKDLYLALARARGISEAAARDLVRSDFALAARSDGDPLERVKAILERLSQRGA